MSLIHDALVKARSDANRLPETSRVDHLATVGSRDVGTPRRGLTPWMLAIPGGVVVVLLTAVITIGLAATIRRSTAAPTYESNADGSQALAADVLTRIIHKS